MRSAVLLLAVVGCASEDPWDRITSLDKRAVGCGQISLDCNPLTAPDDAVLCLNDALNSGQVAVVSWTLRDTAGFSSDTFLFAVDHHVEEYTSHPDDHGGSTTWKHAAELHRTVRGTSRGRVSTITGDRTRLPRAVGLTGA